MLNKKVISFAEFILEQSEGLRMTDKKIRPSRGKHSFSEGPNAKLPTFEFSGGANTSAEASGYALF